MKAALIEEYIEVTQAEKNLEETLRLSFDGSEDQMRDALGVTERDLSEMDAETKLEYERSLAEQKEFIVYQDAMFVTWPPGGRPKYYE